MAAADISKSAQHQAEALAVGSKARANQTATPIGSGQITATIPTAGANACASVTATLTGAAVGDIVLVSGPTVALSHLSAVVGTITAADTITLTGIADATGYTGAAKTYNYVLFRQA